MLEKAIFNGAKSVKGPATDNGFVLSNVASRPAFDIALSSKAKLADPFTIAAMLEPEVTTGVLVFLTHAPITVNIMITEKTNFLSKTFIPINPVFIKLNCVESKIKPSILLF